MNLNLAREKGGSQKSKFTFVFVCKPIYKCAFPHVKMDSTKTQNYAMERGLWEFLVH
jgi:hypothetical protein